MSCEVRQRGRGFFLTATLILVASYAVAVHALLTPRWTEAYRRTFATGEFGIYPRAQQVLDGKNGLGGGLGERVDLGSPRGRRLLGRFEWRKFDPTAPYMVGTQGSIFVRLPDEARSDIGLILRLELQCGRTGLSGLDVLVQGKTVYSGPCDKAETKLSVPFNLSSDRDEYTEIQFRRSGLTWLDELRIRIGLSYEDFAVKSLEIVLGSSADLR